MIALAVYERTRRDKRRAEIWNDGKQPHSFNHEGNSPRARPPAFQPYHQSFIIPRAGCSGLLGTDAGGTQRSKRVGDKRKQSRRQQTRFAGKKSGSHPRRVEGDDEGRVSKVPYRLIAVQHSRPTITTQEYAFVTVRYRHRAASRRLGTSRRSVKTVLRSPDR